MSDINIRRSHQLSPSEIKEKAEQIVQRLQNEHGGEYSWAGDHCVNYKYSGVKANVNFDSDSITVDVKLGLLMMALKGLLEKEIHSYLDKYLA